DIAVAYHGVYLDEGHYATPHEVKEYPLKGSVALSRPLQAAVHRLEIDGDEVTEYCIRGRFVGVADGTKQELEGPDTESSRCRAVHAMLPGELLRHADQRASTLRHLGEDTIDGATADVISYT